MHREPFFSFLPPFLLSRRTVSPLLFFRSSEDAFFYSPPPDIPGVGHRLGSPFFFFSFTITSGTPPPSLFSHLYLEMSPPCRSPFLFPCQEMRAVHSSASHPVSLEPPPFIRKITPAFPFSPHTTLPTSAHTFQ